MSSLEWQTGDAAGTAHANRELLTCEPAAVLPVAQRYFLF